MATRDFSKYFLYRWRYVIGYTLIGLLLSGLLVFAGLYLPGGISKAEMASVVQSASLSLNDPATLAIPNLPYHMLQAFIFKIFGITIFTIKLPSLLLALASAVGLILLLRRWFKPNIAVLASLIAVSTGQFLFIAQSGTPSIMFVFLPIVLLLLGTQITRGRSLRFLWKLLFAISLALSLYTPLSIYPILAIVLATLLHPHLRAVIRRLRRSYLLIASAAFILLIAPLVWLITLNPDLGLILLGKPATWPPHLLENFKTLLEQYFVFWKPSFSEVMTPVFGLGSALIILMGTVRLIRTRETTRSYLIIFWFACLIPVLLLNPQYTAVIFVPAVMMLAAGLTSLIGYWYRLFPLNPYARISGLIPIIILVGVLILTGFLRYVNGYHYNPSVVPLFSKDLALLPKDTHELIVSDDEKPFFTAVAKYRHDLSVVTTPTSDVFVITRDARAQSFASYEIKEIITNERASDADRLYVMHRSAQ